MQITIDINDSDFELIQRYLKGEWMYLDIDVNPDNFKVADALRNLFITTLAKVRWYKELQ